MISAFYLVAPIALTVLFIKGNEVISLKARLCI